MIGGTAKRLIGIQDDGEDTYRRNTILTNIREQRGHSS